MSAFRNKADMPIALQMSAYDPKRTSPNFSCPVRLGEIHLPSSTSAPWPVTRCGIIITHHVKSVGGAQSHCAEDPALRQDRFCHRPGGRNIMSRYVPETLAGVDQALAFERRRKLTVSFLSCRACATSCAARRTSAKWRTISTHGRPGRAVDALQQRADEVIE